MPTGKVLWFRDDIGYGLIQCDDGGRHVFLHGAIKDKAGIETFEHGEILHFPMEVDGTGRRGLPASGALWMEWLRERMEQKLVDMGGPAECEPCHGYRPSISKRAPYAVGTAKISAQALNSRLR